MNKKNIIISIILITVSVLFTYLVKVVDVKEVEIGKIGFATINEFVFNKTGVNMLYYHITDYLGIIPVLMAFIYALIGLMQLIKRKSILKVDREIIILGIFYLILILIYIFFEKVIINYRPILIDGIKEASYPSSHTMLTICLCGSSIMINKKLYNNKLTNYMNTFSIIIILVVVILRLISGVHWFSDILGGIIIASALLMSLYTVLTRKND